MKKAIVTGANGFVGSHLVQELLKHNISVIAMDRKDCCNHLPQSDMVRFIPMDLADLKPLKTAVGETDIDVFYHLAWTGSAGAARAVTALQLQNAQWTVECVRLAKELGCKRFVGAGSIMEYETFTATEKQQNRPGTGYIYGAGKLVAHCMSKSAAADAGIEHVWPMITNAYGAGELSPRFVNTTLRKIIHEEPLQFTSGTQNYDFVYITDVARAFYLIGEKGKPFCRYLIGSSNAKPLKEFILEMKESLAPYREFIFGDVPFTGINLPLEQFDCSETEKDTGFRAEVSFYDGVKKTMDWLKETEV